MKIIVLYAVLILFLFCYVEIKTKNADSDHYCENLCKSIRCKILCTTDDESNVLEEEDIEEEDIEEEEEYVQPNKQVGGEKIKQSCMNKCHIEIKSFFLCSQKCRLN